MPLVRGIHFLNWWPRQMKHHVNVTMLLNGRWLSLSHDFVRGNLPDFLWMYAHVGKERESPSLNTHLWHLLCGRQKKDKDHTLEFTPQQGKTTISKQENKTFCYGYFTCFKVLKRISAVLIKCLTGEPEYLGEIKKWFFSLQSEGWCISLLLLL